MDKYEYRVKTEQMLEYFNENAYQKAMEIADTVDWRKVKNTSMLTTVSEIYENTGELEKARDILFIAYDKAPTSRKIVYRLGTLALKRNQLEEAMDCFEEFVRMAPKDPNQYILKYKILRAQNAPLAQQIEALEEFKHAEYVEKWAYELAKLYHEAGMTEECLEECDDLILWFSEGTYVYQAMELKMKYKPLTPLQLEKYNKRDRSGEEVAPVRKKPIFKKPKERPAPDPRIAQKIRENVHVTGSIDLPDLPEPTGEIIEPDLESLPDERPQPPRPRTKIENTSEIVTTITGATLADVLKTGVAMASGIAIPEEEVNARDPQVTGQMKIEEILAGWEQTQKANAKIIEQNQAEIDRKKLEETAKKKEATPDTKTILSNDIRKLMEELESDEEPVTPTGDLHEIYPDEEPEETEVEEDMNFENMGSIVSSLQLDDFDDKAEEEYEDEDNDIEYEDDEAEEEYEDEDDIEYEDDEAEEEYEYEDDIEYEDDEAEEEYEDEDDIEYEDDEAEEEYEDEDDIEYEDDEVEEYEDEDDDFEYEDDEAEEEYEDEDDIEYEDDEAEEEYEYEDDDIEYEDDEVEEYEDEDGDIEYEDDEVEEYEYEDDIEYEDDEAEEEYEYEDDIEYEDDEAEEEYEDEDDIEYEDDEAEEEYEYEDDDIEYEDDEAEEEYEDEDDIEYEDDEAEEEYADETEENHFDGFDDIFDELEFEEPAPVKKEPDKPQPKVEEVLEIEEPSENEITSRMNKFDTGFIVQGRYDLSATSEIGLKAGLTEEQKKLFSYFVPIRGVSEQIVEVLDNDKRCKNRYGTSRTGNVLVIGKKGTGKTVLAVDIVKAIQKQRKLKQGKVAIVTGESLNKKELSDIIRKLNGGALIIEKAGKMNARTIRELDELMEEQTGELLFVLEDQRKPVERMFAANPSFKKKFTSRLELPVFINDELVTFGQTYAKENGYRIDEMGILALYSRIDVLQREDHAVTVSEVKEIMDEAIEHSQKANVKHLVKRVFGRSTDESDRIILKEEDFKL